MKRNGGSFNPFRSKTLNESSNIADKISIWGYPVVGGSTITITHGYVTGFQFDEDLGAETRSSIKNRCIGESKPGRRSFQYLVGVPSNAWPDRSIYHPSQTVVEWLQSLHNERLSTSTNSKA